MNKQQYKQARRIVRDNGRYGIKFLHQISEQVYQEFKAYVFNIADTNDRLKEREDIVNWCRREGLQYNFRQLQ